MFLNILLVSHNADSSVPILQKEMSQNPVTLRLAALGNMPASPKTNKQLKIYIHNSLSQLLTNATNNIDPGTWSYECTVGRALRRLSAV